MPYTYRQIGHKRGNNVSFAQDSDDCTCEPLAGFVPTVLHIIRVLDPACPVHQSAPED